MFGVLGPLSWLTCHDIGIEKCCQVGAPVLFRTATVPNAQGAGDLHSGTQHATVYIMGYF